MMIVYISLWLFYDSCCRIIKVMEILMIMDFNMIWFEIDFDIIEIMHYRPPIF